MPITATARRSPQRAELLIHILITAIEQGLDTWAQILGYRMPLPAPDGPDPVDMSLHQRHGSPTPCPWTTSSPTYNNRLNPSFAP